MNIYRISLNENTGYNTYDSAIVVANSEDEARKIHPRSFNRFEPDKEIEFILSKDGFLISNDIWWGYDGDWCGAPKEVNVQLVGTTDIYDKIRILCTSYNAGIN